MHEADNDVSHLHAGVVDVVLHFDPIAGRLKSVFGLLSFAFADGGTAGSKRGPTFACWLGGRRLATRDASEDDDSAADQKSDFMLRC